MRSGQNGLLRLRSLRSFLQEPISLPRYYLHHRPPCLSVAVSKGVQFPPPKFVSQTVPSDESLEVVCETTAAWIAYKDVGTNPDTSGRSQDDRMSIFEKLASDEPTAETEIEIGDALSFVSEIMAACGDETSARKTIHGSWSSESELEFFESPRGISDAYYRVGGGDFDSGEESDD
jgi:hypothetical protein